ncbi:G2E3 ligase, partial [Pitta sordida]|nr:G2E3 ligase [Pitta sordida]
CFICGQAGAATQCCNPDCDVSFHLPCAVEDGRCELQTFEPWSAFCPAHSRVQSVTVTPEPGTVCIICMEPVDDRRTYRTLVCPACNNAWFHRRCAQAQAFFVGPNRYCCPNCRNHTDFSLEMQQMGVFVPSR